MNSVLNTVRFKYSATTEWIRSVFWSVCPFQSTRVGTCQTMSFFLLLLFSLKFNFIIIINLFGEGVGSALWLLWWVCPPLPPPPTPLTSKRIPNCCSVTIPSFPHVCRSTHGGKTYVHHWLHGHSWLEGRRMYTTDFMVTADWREDVCTPLTSWSQLTGGKTYVHHWLHGHSWLEGRRMYTTDFMVTTDWREDARWNSGRRERGGGGEGRVTTTIIPHRERF